MYSIPQSSPRPVARDGAAFTLVELLTVIAIIGVLAGLTLGVIGSVRKRARDAVCISNLRQVYVAFNLYANDSKGKWPTPLSHGSATARFLPVRWYNNGQDWYGSSQRNKALDPYLDNIEMTSCPVVVLRQMLGSTEIQYWYSNSGYEPDRMQTERRDANDPYPSLVWCTWPNKTKWANSGGLPHSGGRAMNVLNWDGRVRAVPSTEWRAGSYP